MAMLLASYLDISERAGHLIVFTSIPLFLLSGAAWPCKQCQLGCSILLTSSRPLKGLIYLFS
jgi:hypothetical protein